MGCMQVQQRSVANLSFPRRPERKTLRRISPIPKKSVLSAESWKSRTLRTLSRLVESTIAFAWVPAVKLTLSAWSTEEDAQWTQCLKQFYTRKSAIAKRRKSVAEKDKQSIWRRPGMSIESLMEESDYTDFLSKTLRRSHNHGIAVLIQTFCESFTDCYRDNDLSTGVPLAETMKRDILEFSRIAEEALEQFYEPIDLLALFQKSKHYLEFVIREVILEAKDVKELLIEAIKGARVGEDLRIREKYEKMGNCDLAEIDPNVRQELLQAARSQPGFSASVLLLQRLPELPSLTEQVQTVYSVSEGVNDTILYIVGENVHLFPTADDLLTLCTFLLLHAASADLGAYLNLLSSLIPSDVVSEATNYSLATLETALEFIASKLPLPP